MAEGGRRDLPSAALMRLSEMELALLDTVAVPALAKAVDRGSLKKYVAACNFEARATRRKLAALETQYEQSRLQLQVIAAFQRKEKGSDAAGTKQLWLRLQENLCLKKLRRCGPAARLKLEIHIQGLELAAGLAAQAGL